MRQHALRFGRTGRWRFDDPEREYGVLYTAQTPAGALAETLLPEPGALTVTAVVPVGTVPVSGAALDRHALSEITFARRGPALGTRLVHAPGTAGCHLV
ncbi:MAG: RES domain-containing protein [bacterium]|nr:RES domain-containing protein [bacterium]